MIRLKNKTEIRILQEGGRKLASVLNKLSKMIVPGVATLDIEMQARKLIKSSGGKPAFLGYRPRGAKDSYPGAVCFAINDEVVHSPPSDKVVLKEGDIIGLDIGLEYKNLFTDAAITVGVGRISDKDKKLINVTKECLDKGIAVLKDGATTGDFGYAVQTHAEKNEFSVVRILVGHGVGYAPHEEPDVPNFGEKSTGIELKEGMVLALEPMVCAGKSDVVLGDDGWVYKTKDGLKSAQFEHTIVIEKEKSSILTKE